MLGTALLILIMILGTGYALGRYLRQRRTARAPLYGSWRVVLREYPRPLPTERLTPGELAAERRGVAR
jgi:hypothetical protein